MLVGFPVSRHVGVVEEGPQPATDSQHKRSRILRSHSGLTSGY